MGNAPEPVEDSEPLPPEATGPRPEDAALRLSLTPEEMAQLSATLDPFILELLALC